MGILSALELLQGEIKEAFSKVNADTLEQINEIRLRTNKYVSVSIGKHDFFLTKEGRLSDIAKGSLISNDSDIEFAFKTAFSYSLHSYSKELASGYITTKGGNRVGICGTAVISGQDYSEVETLKYISSINIRIARESKGFADKLIDKCFAAGPSGILIIGAPSSGKTTLLRDAARLIGSRHRISLIDEQNEISATYRNCAYSDIGPLTDVFVGYPKHLGISTAVRVMSPKIIIVDEIATKEDVKAMELALHSGVKLITAIHGESLQGARKKVNAAPLISAGAFDYAAVLNDSHEYTIEKID